MKVILKNMKTGKIIISENGRSRLIRMRQRIVTWCEAVESCEAYSKCRRIMFTLTYDRQHTWEKNDIRDFNTDLRNVVGKEKILGYAWVAEMQKRKEVHYHCYWIVAKDVFIPKLDEAGIWKKGMTRVSRGRSPFYIVKYVGKEEQKKNYPKGIRAFNVYLNKGQVSKMEYKRFQFAGMPKWLQEEVFENYRFLVHPKIEKIYGGYLLSENGKEFFIESPYVMVEIRSDENENEKTE